MAEYISREEVLKHLNECKEDPLFDPDMARICCAISIFIEEMQAADVQPVDRWTSIEESKPKDMQQVLAVVDGDVREAFYNAGCFIGSNFYRSINEVKWWQSLPEPPKDGDTNG